LTFAGLMFLSYPRAVRSRITAVHRLCRHYLAENTSEARAWRLLRNWLSSAQRVQFDESGCFEVVGCDTGKRYRVYRRVAPNVCELDDAGQPKEGLCFIPAGQLVLGDVMLAQKVALETDERSALAAANRFPPGRTNWRPF